MTESELRNEFVNMAISYAGAKEGSTKHKTIVDNYNKIKPLPRNYKANYKDPWCAIFVSSCAYSCDLLDIIPAECSCNKMIELAKKMGIWVENDAYVPKVADIILYDWQDNGSGDNTGSADHVGIVVSISGNTIKIIEGNYNDAVGYRNIAVNGRYIRGYITPKFSSKVTEKESTSTSNKGSLCQVKLNILKQGSKGADVKALQILLIGNDFSCGKTGIDGKFGSNTSSAVRQYQKSKGLVQDGVVGAKTWAALLGK